MTRQTLLGHLALKFATHPENLATEALHYILEVSPHARTALMGACSIGLDDLPSDLRFRTQVAGADAVIPDLVGFDEAGSQRLIIEAKFWASLTDPQPVGYLNRLPTDKTGVVLVLAPTRRFATLWPELVRRCSTVGLPIDQKSSSNDSFRWAAVTPPHALGLMSWRSLLTAIGTRVSAAGEVQITNEVAQLLGLCERMDAEAFLPIRSEELDSVWPRRLDQYLKLLDDVVATCIERKLCDKKGLRAAAGAGWYGHYLRMRGVGIFLYVDTLRWSTLRATPFWLRVAGKDWKNAERERELLRPLEYDTPPRLLRDQYWDHPLVPLFPPLGAERVQVLEGLLAQVEQIYRLLTDNEAAEIDVDDEQDLAANTPPAEVISEPESLRSQIEVQ